ncbi:MAG: phosphoesterase PA-phosphatase related [Caulobacteraceae bacterium]|nr:phosphoesterase PA-phosphatase related [Caulobacteraceae bacterium]
MAIAPPHDVGPPRKAHRAAWRDWLLREIGPVAAVLVVTVGLWLFLVVADEMGEGETARIDRAILFGLRQAGDPHLPLGPKWLHVAAADVTSFGSVTGLTLIVALIAGYFAAFRRYREALILVAAAASGSLVSQALKQFFGRERPPMVLHAVEVMNPSFPSGHAMLSAVVYLTLAVLIARFSDSKRVKAYSLGAGIVMTLLVGASRVYLGVHWPSDVLAGWSLGAAWALAWWLLAWALVRFGPFRARASTTKARR